MSKKNGDDLEISEMSPLRKIITNICYSPLDALQFL